MKISTAQEAINGNSNDTVITPLRLKQVLNSKNIGGGGSGGITKEIDPVFNASPAAGITDEDIENWDKKQDGLSPGSNIKNINGESILGNGNISTVEVQVGSVMPTSTEKVWFKKGDTPNLHDGTKYSVNISALGVNGDIVSPSSWNRWQISEYIEIEPNTEYTIGEYLYSSMDYYNAWYDENKTLISTFLRGSGANRPNPNPILNVVSPSNAKYLRLTVFRGVDGDNNDERPYLQVKKTTSNYTNSILIAGREGNFVEFFNFGDVPKSTSQLENDSNFINQIKTINGQSLIGEGDVVIEGGSGSDFDGEVVPNELIQAGLTDRTSLTISSAWQLSEVPFNTETAKIGTGLTLTENGHIKIGSGINKVRIEGNLLVYPTVAGTLDARFYRLRNGTYINLGNYYVDLDTTNEYRTCLLSIPVLDVEENDELCIRVTSDTASTLTISNNAYLYVEKINENNIIVGGSGGVTDETDPIFKSSPAGSITTSDIENWNAKQEALVSGTNIKTINGQDILGEGNIVIEGGSTGGSSGVDTIYKGQLLGGDSVELSGVKRFLDIYFVVSLTNHRIFGKYTMDTTLKEPNFGSVLLMASDGSTGLDYYISESKFESSTNTLTHTRTGYFNISKSTYTDRNGVTSYHIYRIDTYDEPVTVITENITETDPVFVASPAYTITEEDIEKWNNPQEVPESSISYNVGDVVITNSNVGKDEISNRFGGEWELFDKEFSNAQGQGALIINSNTTEEYGYWLRNGHTVQISLRWKNAVQLDDDNVKIGDLDYAKLGIKDELYFGQTYTGYTDGGDCTLMVVVNPNGSVEVVDVVPDNYVSVDKSNFVTVILQCYKDNMLDSACDKFYWKKLV